jgi:hypothetical protein
MKKATKTAKTTTPAQPAPSPAKKSVPKLSSVKVTEAALRAKAVVAKPVVATPPPVKEDVPVASSTKITAQIDVGFGNTLYLRGDGPGLSWEKGLVLDCVADDKWSISFLDASEPVVFKFLINDQTWSLGDDFVAPPGADLTVSPTF